VLVTRPEHQADDLGGPFAELGARVLFQAAIAINAPATGWSLVDRSLDVLDRFDWIVFSSANGVRHYLDRLAVLDRDVRLLAKPKIACIGSATAAELARYHLKADLIPDEFRAESLAQALQGAAAGKRFLLIRASRGREVLAEELSKAGGLVEQVVAYESTDIEQPESQIAAEMAAGQIDWTTVTSSAIARALVKMFSDNLKKTKLASISPITSATLRELGFEPAAEASEYKMSGVIDAVRKQVASP
jgi:uroporphyrinogen III methyltransferase/synthase